jgi:peptide/nickel transport system permease protein
VAAKSKRSTGASKPSRIARSQWLTNLALAVRTTRGRVGLGLTGLVVLVAVIGPFVAPHSPTALLSVPFSKPSSSYPFGTDALGRDVLSRLLAGGWILLVMACIATLFGVIVGAVAGISAAYLRGKSDNIIMRLADVVLAFPQIVFALLLVSIAGPKLWLIVLAVGFTHAPGVARVLRSAALDVTERDFVKAAELEGVSPNHVMTHEILPNLVTPLMVETGLRLTYSIGIIAGLGFLGFGQAPPAPNWGLMISENLLGVQANPWAVIVPAAAIALLAIGTNTFTDAIARVAIGVERPLGEAELMDAVASEGAA